MLRHSWNFPSFFSFSFPLEILFILSAMRFAQTFECHSSHHCLPHCDLLSFSSPNRVQLSTCNDKRLLQKDLSSEMTRNSNSTSNSSFSSSTSSTSNCYSSAKDHGYSSRPSQRCKSPSFSQLSLSHLASHVSKALSLECPAHLANEGLSFVG